MKIFWSDRKITEDTVKKTVQTTSNAYGAKNPQNISGFAGTFLFSLGDVYISDEIDKEIEQHHELSELATEFIKRFLKGDYGKICKDDIWNNNENRYIGGGSYMVARYLWADGRYVLFYTTLKDIVIQFETEPIRPKFEIPLITCQRII